MADDTLDSKTIAYDYLVRIREAQKAHETHDQERFQGVHETLKIIQENHLFHIEKDIAALKEDNAIQKIDLGAIKVDMAWVKWAVMALLGGVGAIFLALVIRGL